MPVKWNAYQAKIREYDICAARVERSQETTGFNQVLIHLIAREIPSRNDIVSELQAAMPLPLTLKDNCPPQPTIFKTFFSEGNDQAKTPIKEK